MELQKYTQNQKLGFDVTNLPNQSFLLKALYYKVPAHKYFEKEAEFIIKRTVPRGTKKML